MCLRTRPDRQHDGARRTHRIFHLATRQMKLLSASCSISVSLLYPGTAILHTLYSHQWAPEPIWSWFTATSGAPIVCPGLKCRSVSTCFMVPLRTLQHKKREFTSNCIDSGKNVESSDSTGKHTSKFNLSAKFRLSKPLRSNTSTADFIRLFLILHHFAVF
jgi:hypothetical protein